MHSQDNETSRMPNELINDNAYVYIQIWCFTQAVQKSVHVHDRFVLGLCDVRYRCDHLVHNIWEQLLLERYEIGLVIIAASMDTVDDAAQFLPCWCQLPCTIFWGDPGFCRPNSTARYKSFQATVRSGHSDDRDRTVPDRGCEREKAACKWLNCRNAYMGKKQTH